VTGLPEAPEPLGFGNCPQCPYREVGDVVTCSTCAKATLEQIPEGSCELCEGRLRADGTCGNPLCNRPVEARGWDFTLAIARRSGELERAIDAYKVNDKYGWGWIFARVLVGYLEDLDVRDSIDLIIPMPTYVGSAGRQWDHIGYIIERAKLEGPRWPFRTDVMAKTGPTRRLRGLTFAQLAQVVEQELRPVLTVLDRDAVNCKLVVVFDDVFTGGLTLREVAFKLREAGAQHIVGLVLARQPFGGA
jgi:predicted amidophosphoribosyltransferase